MGRFINADSYASTGQGILGNNMFAYCGNNPVIHGDPTGTCFKVCGMVLIDCCQSNCLDSRYYNAKRIAIIYDARQSGIFSGGFLGQGYDQQGRELSKRLGENNYVETYPSYDADGFIESWNSLVGAYDEIYIICHSEYGNLYFAGDDIYFEEAKHCYSDLQAVNVGTIYLYICNGATSEKGHSVSSVFGELTGAEVHAIKNGKIGFTWEGCYAGPTHGGEWDIRPGK